jgi:hypothetical protein
MKYESNDEKSLPFEMFLPLVRGEKALDNHREKINAMLLQKPYELGKNDKWLMHAYAVAELEQASEIDPSKPVADIVEHALKIMRHIGTIALSGGHDRLYEDIVKKKSECKNMEDLANIEEAFLRYMQS